MLKSVKFRFNKILDNRYIVLGAIVVFAFLARTYKISNPIADWHSWRQADTASVAKNYVNEGVDLLHPRYHDISTIQTGLFNPEGYRFVEFPLYNAVHAWLYTLFPVYNFDVWGRLLSIISSLAAVVLIFYITRRFLGVYAGYLASFFLAFLPFNIYFSRVILPEQMSVMFALLALWLFILFRDSKNLYYFYLSSVSFSLAVLVKPYTVFFALPLLYVVIKDHGFTGAMRLRRYWFYALIILVPFFLWRGWISQFPEGIPFWKWTFNGDGIRFKPSFWKWIFGERLTKLILGYWGIIPFIFGVLAERKEKFLISLLFGMFLYVSVVASANVRHDYYQTMIIPAVSIFLAAGSIHMWKSKTYGSVWVKALLTFSIFVMFSSGISEIKEFYKINHPEIIKAGMAADSIIPEGSLVIAPYNADTAFLYQTNRWGWPYKDREIEDLITMGAEYYISVNYDELTREIMETYTVLVEVPDYVIVKLAD